MNIYNNKKNLILYVCILSFFLKDNIFQNEALHAQTKTVNPLILNNDNKKNSADTIFNKTTPYLINIFCTENDKKRIKIVSGSGVFLTKPSEKNGLILTNAHVARHLLDTNKKCSGRTGHPALTTHTLKLKYIPTNWLNQHNKYILGDIDQSSTGEYDFAIIETNRIKPLKNQSNIFLQLQQGLKLRLSNYGDLKNLNIYSYPAQSVLMRNIRGSIYQKKDAVYIIQSYSNPNDDVAESLLDVTGSKYIERGSSGGMVLSEGLSNSMIGLSSVLIKDNYPQTVRVITLKHIIFTIKKDLDKINTSETNNFLYTLKEIMKEKEADKNLIDTLLDIRLNSYLNSSTNQTLSNLNIIK